MNKKPLILEILNLPKVEGALGESLDDTVERINHRSGGIELIGKGLDGIRQELRGIREEQGETNELLGNMEQEIEGVQGELEDVKGEVEELKGEVVGLKAQVVELKNRVLESERSEDSSYEPEAGNISDKAGEEEQKCKEEEALAEAEIYLGEVEQAVITSGSPRKAQYLNLLESGYDANTVEEVFVVVEEICDMVKASKYYKDMDLISPLEKAVDKIFALRKFDRWFD